MATRNRKSGKRGTRPTKPTTIDSTAKEVEAGADTAKKAVSSAATDKTEKPTSTSGSGTQKPKEDPKSGETKQFGRSTASKTSASVEKTIDTRKTTNTPPPSVKRGGGLGTMFLSAIFGSALTIGGLGAIGSTGQGESLPLVGSLFSGSGKKTGEMENQVATLSSTVETLRSQLNEAQAASAKAIAEVEALKTDGGDETAVANKSAIQSLSNTISNLEQDLANRQEEISKLQSDLQALGTTDDKLARIETQLSETPGVPPATIDTLQQGLAEAEVAIDTLRKQMAEVSQTSVKVETRIGQLEDTINQDVVGRIDTVAKAAENATASERVAKSVSLSAMQSAMERGVSYLSALASYETLAGETEDIAKLKALAGNGGAASPAQLASEFAAVSQKMLAELSPVTSEESSLMDRLAASAKSLVTVRKSGPVEGTSPEAVVSRIGAATEAGELQTVITEWDGLPPKAQEVGADWLSRVKARIEAQGLMEKLIGEANTTG